MSITIKGASSGGVDIVAPASGSDVTLTLPSTTATVETTASSIASSRLTGALPALDGSSLTGVGVDGIVSTANATAITIDSDEATTFASNKAGWGMDFTNSNASGYGLKISAGSGTNHALKVRDKDSNELLVVHGNGNMGLGVEPESSTNTTDLYIGSRTSVVNWGNGSYFPHNAYENSSSWKYRDTAAAAMYSRNNNGEHIFEVASSGTADSAITFTTALTIGNSGSVDIHDFSGNGARDGFFFENRLQMERSTTSGTTQIVFYNPNGDVGSIDTSGSSTSYNTSSDYRLKENFVPITDSITRVKALQPYRFNFIADPDKTVDGFVAHEAGEVVPEAVSGEKDAMTTEEYEITPEVDGVDAVMGEREIINPQGIDQSKLVPLLTAALQDAIKRIEILENA